jgi:hypothetical protein
MGFSGLSAAQPEITAIRSGSKIDIFIKNSLFTSYIFLAGRKVSLFLSLLTVLPMQECTSMRNANYPHHSSLFFGCDHVNGGNYWQEGLERGQIISL